MSSKYLYQVLRVDASSNQSEILFQQTPQIRNVVESAEEKRKESSKSFFRKRLLKAGATPNNLAWSTREVCMIMMKYPGNTIVVVISSILVSRLVSSVFSITSPYSTSTSERKRNRVVYKSKSPEDDEDIRHDEWDGRNLQNLFTTTLSMSTSVTNTTSSKWYPDYSASWAEAVCKNTTPYPTYTTTFFDSQLECCMGAFASQPSGACIEDIDKDSSMLAPTTSTQPPIALPATAIPTTTPIVVAPATPTGMCDFCSSGITTDKLNILAIDLLDRDYTCQSLQSFASTIPSSNSICANVVQSVEFICCPPIMATDPCNFCSAGSNIKLDYIIPNTNGTTCGTAALFSASLEGNATECATVKNAEMLCCPTGLDSTEDELLLDQLMSMEMSMMSMEMSMMSIPPASASCIFCEGKAVQTETVIPTMLLKCGELVSYATSLKESSMECNTVVEAELYCCNNDSSTSTSLSPTYSPTVADTKASMTTLKPTIADESEKTKYKPCFLLYYCVDSSRYVSRYFLLQLCLLFS